MCGIFGAIRASGQFARADYEEFVRLTDVVRYRGPNDGGYLALSVRSSQMAGSPEGFDTFLGNRRLSILDLSPLGHMPMTDGQGRWITYNGEIFNYLELKRELQAEHNYAFRTGTDTEVILALYAVYGEQGFAKLNGMWAFALVDLPARRAVLSRDRFSIKPLYLANRDGATFFASEIKQLLPLLPSKQLHEETMMAFLSQGLLDHGEETFFQGIRRIPPRTTITISYESGEINRSEYWHFGPAQQQPIEDALLQFRDLLADSVRLRLRSDVKVGVLLSGGLDSSSVAMLAKQHGEVQTYSIVAEDPKHDERVYIDAVASCGLRNRKIVFRPNDLHDQLEAALYHSDEPVGGFSVIAQYWLFDAIKRASNATVLLSGQGGDEILLGYLKFFLFYLRGLYRAGSYRQALTLAAMAVLQRTVLRQVTLGEARRYSPFLHRRAHRILRRERPEIRLGECPDLRTRQIADIERFSVPALTHYEDRNSAAHSLEVRHPFLDHRLVDFVVSLPTEAKIHHGWTKYILRRAMPELPAAVRWRRDKQGFLVPEKHWLQHTLRSLIEDRFRKSALSRLGILDDAEFLAQYKSFRNGGPVASGDIARVFLAEEWARSVFP